MINRVFSKRGDPDSSAVRPSALSSELSTSDIENYYLTVVVDCLRRMLLPLDSFEVRIRRSGVGPGGLSALAAYIRILKWNPVITPILLQNLPVIDGRVRKVVNASVILEATHFAGLWFQAGSCTEGSPKSLFGLPCELIHQQRSAAATA
jgi:hypothetical protein